MVAIAGEPMPQNHFFFNTDSETANQITKFKIIK